MDKKNKTIEKNVLLVWFNGMEIESIRYAINSFIDNEIIEDYNFENGETTFDDIKMKKLELEKIEDKFDHKILNFQFYDGLKISLSKDEISKLIEITAKEIDREREIINELKKEFSLVVKENEEIIKKKEIFSYKQIYFKEIIRLNDKLKSRLKLQK